MSREAETVIDDLVWQDAERVSGAPCFYGRRVPIQTLFDYLAGGETIAEFCLDYSIPREQAEGVVRLGLDSILGRLKAA